MYKPSRKAEGLALLFIHGWTGKPNDRAAEVLADNGFCSMTFSMRGHNDSEGKINSLKIAEFLHDAVTAYDYFKKHMPPDIRVAVVGNSFGGYLATLLASLRPVEALSLRVPANYDDSDFNQSKMTRSGSDNPDVLKWRTRKLGRSENKALNQISRFEGKVQIIEAEKDDVIPHQTIKNYIDAVTEKSNLEYHLMKDWPHSLGDDETRNKQFQQLLVNWVKKVAGQL